MEKIVEQGILYDFYGPLLNDHQKDIYEAYVYDNMSLSELASEQGVSRQAVHDIIKRCDALLKGYEEKLGLVKRFNISKDKLIRLKSLIDDMTDINEDSHKEMTDMINGLIDEI